MGLVEKTSFHDGSFRRTAFKWTGVELDRLEPDRGILDVLLLSVLGISHTLVMKHLTEPDLPFNWA